MTTISGQIVWPELAAALHRWMKKHGFMSVANVLRTAGALGLAGVARTSGQAMRPAAMIGRRFQVSVSLAEHASIVAEATAAGTTVQKHVTGALCAIVGCDYRAPESKRVAAPKPTGPTPAQVWAAKLVERAAAKQAQREAERAALRAEKEAEKARRDADRAELRRARIAAEAPVCPVPNPSADFLRWLAR